MADEQVYMRQNDVMPYLDVTLKDYSGAYPYSTDDTIRFVMKSSDDTIKINQSSTGSFVTFLSSTAGTVRYMWSSSNGDTDTPGDFLADFELTTPTGKQVTFPNNGHLAVVITPELST